MAMRPSFADDGDMPLNHEINVTPFIDVMLVLLIIFMVAAPLSTVDIPVELLVSQALPAAKPDKPLYVTLKGDLSLAVGNDMVLWGGLGPALDAQTSSDRNKRLFLRADPSGFTSCLVFLPRDRYTTTVGQDVEALLTGALDGGSAEHTLHVTESALARLHVVVRPRPGERLRSGD